MLTNTQDALKVLSAQVEPWRLALANPQEAQESTLNRLISIYSQTIYGKNHNAEQIETIRDYQRLFPIQTYDTYKPLIQRVMAGEINLLLNEEPIGWAITRGTTKGESKFIPMTPTDLKLRTSASRAMLNYVISTNRFDIFSGVNLNLNFPSIVGEIDTGNQKIEYGYSSGIYTKYVSKFTPIMSAPTQEQIDALGGGKSIQDWERRFDLAYQECKDLDVTLVGGVCPTAIRFGKYLRKKHRIYPKQIWNTQIMTLGSVPGINTRYQDTLKALFGPVIIREIYGATEGIFGQQLNHKRGWSPNYDLFFFEVATRNGLKLLREMRPGEYGSLIVSTPILSRYRIGDLILAFQPPYFRCIGREHWFTPILYFWGELSSFNLGRL